MSALIQKRLALMTLGLLAVLTVVSYDVSQISATEYAGSISVQNRAHFPVVIEELVVTVYDEAGDLIATATTTTPQKIKAGETQTFEWIATLSEPLDILSEKYEEGSRFLIVGDIKYKAGMFPQREQVEVTLTKSQIQSLYQEMIG